MASPAIQNPPSASTESKSARKKKAKAESSATTESTTTLPIIPQALTKEDSSLDAKDVVENGHFEHPYIRELNKHVRNIHKKITGLQKTEATIAANPGVSLDELVSQKKINADQKNSIQKKPQLEAQLSGLEEQMGQYKKLDADYQSQMQKQKEELTAQHEKALEKSRDDASVLGVTNSVAELRKKLLIFSQFLRCAAAKRTIEEDVPSEETKAFEGALLLVYGGDDNAVQAAIDLIEGSGEKVPGVDGVLSNVTFAEVKNASLAHAPFQTEENWVDSVAEATAPGAPAEPDVSIPTTDPTIAHAGLTELDTTSGQPNGVHGIGGEDPLTSPPQGDAGAVGGNAAGDKWDPNAATAEKGLVEDEYEMVPRPQDELETSVAGGASRPDAKMSWADDHPTQPPSYEGLTASGNAAGESWDAKPAGAEEDASLADAAALAGAEGNVNGSADRATAGGEDADGFHQVAGRHHRGRGRGGRGFRGGRGGERGGFRGEGGEFRGRGRGGFRGRGEGGEFRGRGDGRGRGGRGGPRGGAAADGQTRAS